MTEELKVKTQTAKIELPEEGLKLENGGALPELQVAYETYGELTEDKDNVIFICHALSGDAHVAGISDEDGRNGWWDEMVGPGKGIDTNLYFVVCANILGGCKGTTGPSSIDPSTGKPYGSKFPHITVSDVVDVHVLLLKHLGIDKLAAVIGGSFGGMQVLEWAAKYPEQINRCICIASATSLSAQALAFDVVGRKSIIADPAWNEGDYYDESLGPDRGLAHARMIGHITYLSQDMMAKKFGRERKGEQGGDSDSSTGFESDFQVESYLDHQGRKFVDRFDANSYLLITKAMDEFDFGSRYGGLEKAFELIKSKLLIVALSEDWLFTPGQSRDLARKLMGAGRHVSYCELVAPHGHDAFLLEIENLGSMISAFLPWVEGRGNAELRKQRLEQRAVGSLESCGFASISNIIEKGSRVLDLGCGDGSLLQHLADSEDVKSLGVDYDISHVISVIDRGLDAFHSDIDEELEAIPDSSFDYVILNDSLQVVRKPRDVINQALRIGSKCIVSFPNFGNWGHRLSLLFRGRMPKGGSLPFEWYNTPNIHLFTVRDFVELCDAENVKIVSADYYYGSFLNRTLGVLGLCNAGADYATMCITRNDELGEKQ